MRVPPTRTSARAWICSRQARASPLLVHRRHHHQQHQRHLYGDAAFRGRGGLYLEKHPWASPGTVASALTGMATPNRVGKAGTGSPNLLLYAGLGNISLRSSAWYYVVAEGGDGREVLANRTAIGAWDRFTLVDLNDGALTSGDYVYLQADNSNYVTAEGSGNSVVNANRTAPAQWETFRIWKLNGSGTIFSGDSVALQSCYGC